MAEVAPVQMVQNKLLVDSAGEQSPLSGTGSDLQIHTSTDDDNRTDSDNCDTHSSGEKRPYDDTGYANSNESRSQRRKQMKPVRVSETSSQKLPENVMDPLNITTKIVISAFKCDFCDKSFETKPELDIHFENYHFDRAEQERSPSPRPPSESQKARPDLPQHSPMGGLPGITPIQPFNYNMQDSIMQAFLQQGGTASHPAAMMHYAMLNMQMEQNIHAAALAAAAQEQRNEFDKQQMTPTIVQKNGTTTGPSLPRIFNAEAFCEICNKEFCNKYFLKTHKANKHGVYSPSEATSQSAPFYGSYLPPQSSQLIPTGLESMARELKDTPESALPPAGDEAEVFCDICKKAFLNKYYLHHHKESAHGITDEQLTPNLPPRSTPLRSLALPSPVSTLATKKEFDMMAPSDNKLQIPSDITPPFTGIGKGGVEFNSPGKELVPIPVSGMEGVLPLAQTITNPEAYCEICNKEFCNKYFLHSHKLNMHGIGVSTPGPKPYGRDNILNSIRASAPQTNLMSIFSRQSGISTSREKDVRPPSTEQTAVGDSPKSTADPSQVALCPLCHKEFCSKQFLSAHLMNKHGISESSLMSLTPTSRQPSTMTALIDRVKMEVDERRLREQMLQSKMEEFRLEQLLRAPTQGKINGDRPSLLPRFDTDLKQEAARAVQCDQCSQWMPSNESLMIHKWQFHRMSPLDAPTESRKSESGSADRTSPASGGSREGSTKEINQGPPAPSSKDGTVCNICNKEVANKYFLRAHKLNEHGVLSNEDGTDNIGTLPKFGGIGDMTKDMARPASTNASMALMPFVSRSPTMGSDPVSVPSSTVGSSPFMASLTGSGSLPTMVSGSPVMVVDPEAYCEICKKEFCSKYFLRTHKLNIHGLQSDQQMSQGMKFGPGPKKYDGEGGDLGEPGKVECSPLFSGRNFCDICNKELCNKYFLRTHMLKMHGIMIDDKGQSQAASLLPPSGLDLLRDRLDHGSVVKCELCNKEMANSVMLKIHKLNAHGMDANDDAPVSLVPRGRHLERDAENASTSSTSSGPISINDEMMRQMDIGSRYFSHYTEVCRLCDRRFKSQKWLKSHMVTDHGQEFNEMEHGPAGNAKEESKDQLTSCDKCGTVCSDIIALQLHMIKKHKNEISEKMNQNNDNTQSTRPKEQLAQESMKPKYADMFDGKFLSQGPEKEMLETKYPSIYGNGDRLPMENNSMMGSYSFGSHSASDIAFTRKYARSTKKRMYTCSYCPYSTRWLSNLYAHEKRHPGASVRGEKKFVCQYCHRAYRYQHSLHRHLLSHIDRFGNHRMTPVQINSGIGLSSRKDSNLLAPIKNRVNPDSPIKTKRYRCRECGIRFRDKELCRDHVRKIHGRGGGLPFSRPKLYSCKRCTFVTKFQTLLKSHYTNTHNVDMPEELAKDERPPITKNGHAGTNGSGIPPNVVTVNGMNSDEEEHDGNKGTSPTHPPICYATPKSLSSQSSFIMQPFILQEADGAGNFVTSTVYLPVRSKVSETVSTSFTLTPTEQ